MPATYELRRISPDKLARIMAWVTGAILLVICLFMFLMFMFAPPRVEPQAPKSLFLIFLILYPLFGAFWAWVCGQLMARVYNFVARKKGGVTFEACSIGWCFGLSLQSPNFALQRAAFGIKCSAAGGRAKSAHERWRARVLKVISPSLSLVVRRH